MKKKILILGGTRFIGRTLVDRLLATSDFELTLFNRGKTQGHLFPELNKIKGDRETDDILKVAGENWDFVIDVSCYYPDALQRALKTLSGNTGKYILISSCSAYDMENQTAGLVDEDAPLYKCSSSQWGDRSDSSYGPRKAECDRILTASGLNHVILRPAMVYGPYDHTDRFYFWLHQIYKQDPILVPSPGERKFTLTYVEDVVDMVVHSLYHQTPSSIYNVTSNPEVTLRQIIDLTGSVTGRTPREVSAPPAFLKKEGIRQWLDIPLWINSDRYTYNNLRIKDELGMVPKPFLEGIRRSVEYYTELGWPEPKYGISEEVRQGLLEKLS